MPESKHEIRLCLTSYSDLEPRENEEDIPPCIAKMGPDNFFSEILAEEQRWTAEKKKDMRSLEEEEISDLLVCH